MRWYILVHPDLRADASDDQIIQMCRDQAFRNVLHGEVPKLGADDEVVEIRTSKLLPPGAAAYLINADFVEKFEAPYRR